MSRKELLEQLRGMIQTIQPDDLKELFTEDGPTAFYLTDERKEATELAVFARDGGVIKAILRGENEEQTYEFRLEELQ